jgi:hypothetical protein
MTSSGRAAERFASEPSLLESEAFADELLLDVEYRAEPADVVPILPPADDPGILELDQELLDDDEASPTPAAAEPLIRISVATGPLRPRPYRNAGSSASPGFARGPLAQQLVKARNQATLARAAERRSHEALYHAVGCAYDFALAAAGAPEEFARLIGGAEIDGRKRMTTVVKLVFGADYDKTRVAEYAAVLSFASRLDLPNGSVTAWLSQARGGLRGVVAAERELRRQDGGGVRYTKPRLRNAVATRLRALPVRDIDELAEGEEEFVVILARREPDGSIAVLGEVTGDDGLLSKAASRLVGEDD